MNNLSDVLSKNAGYKFEVRYSQRFVDGPMKGRTYDLSKVRFCDWQSADKFAATCDGKTVITPCVGGSKYIKECPILEAI